MKAQFGLLSCACWSEPSLAMYRVRLFLSSYVSYINSSCHKKTWLNISELNKSLIALTSSSRLVACSTDISGCQKFSYAQSGLLYNTERQVCLKRQQCCLNSETQIFLIRWLTNLYRSSNRAEQIRWMKLFEGRQGGGGLLLFLIGQQCHVISLLLAFRLFQNSSQVLRSTFVR